MQNYIIILKSFEGNEGSEAHWQYIEDFINDLQEFLEDNKLTDQAGFVEVANVFDMVLLECTYEVSERVKLFPQVQAVLCDTLC